MPPPPEACADVRKRVRQLVAFFAAREESTLADCHSLRNDYGLGEIHLRALAKPLTHISAEHGGRPVTQVEAQKCDTLGDCVVLVTGKLA